MTKKKNVGGTRTVFIASAYSFRAGSRKKALGRCAHEHRTRRGAQACADRQPTKLAKKVFRHWKVDEVVMVPSSTSASEAAVRRALLREGKADMSKRLPKVVRR